MKRIALAAAVLAGLAGTASARPRHHEPPPAPSTAGAIAYSPSTGVSGWSWGYGDLGGAENAALGACGQGDCYVLTWENGSAAAYASGDGGMGWASNGDLGTAEQQAIDGCSSTGATNCHLVAWVSK